MRKADYMILTQIIKAQLQYAASMEAAALTESRREYARGVIRSCETIALEFALSARLDKNAFLSACGIK